MKPEEIAKAREHLGMSKPQFAKALGLGSNGRRKIQRWEVGFDSMPKAFAAKIAMLIQMKDAQPNG